MQKTQKNRFIACLITATVISSSLAIFSQPIAQARRPRKINLLKATCVSSGLGSVREENMDVSIGRAVYSSQFYLGPGYRSASMTCKIKPDSRPQPIFQTLNLGFGMRDNDNKSPGVEVRVYLDGNQVESRTVSPSQQTTLSLDVSKVSNVAIEAVCSSSSQYCDRVYFFDAKLLPPEPTPKPTTTFEVQPTPKK
jgi:hypothetical protein